MKTENREECKIRKKRMSEIRKKKKLMKKMPDENKLIRQNRKRNEGKRILIEKLKEREM